MIDFSFLDKFTKGNEQKIKRYIQIYLVEAGKTFQQMELNLQQEDWEQLRINTHSLKPQAELMGISELHATLIQLEQDILEGKTDKALPLYQQARELHVKAEESLTERIGEINSP